MFPFIVELIIIKRFLETSFSFSIILNISIGKACMSLDTLPFLNCLFFPFLFCFAFFFSFLFTFALFFFAIFSSLSSISQICLFSFFVFHSNFISLFFHHVFSIHLSLSLILPLLCSFVELFYLHLCLFFYV
jgi:hypothetical protein